MTWAPCPHGVRTRGKKLDDLSSPGSAVSCRQMPVAKGKKTLQTCNHTGLARSRSLFAMTQQFTDLEDTFWHLWVPKGAELTSLRGGVPFRTFTCRLSSFAMAATD